MFEIPYLFWYKPVFMAELLIAEWMFAFCLKKHKHFLMRQLAALVICFGIAFAFPIFWYNAIYSSVMFLLLFAVAGFTMKLCYDEPWLNIIFCALAAYTTRHIAYTLYDSNILLLGMSDGLIIGIYGESGIFKFNILTAVIYINAYFFTYWLLLLSLGSRLRNHEGLILKNISFLILAAFIVFIDIILNAFVVYYSYDVFDKIYIIYLFIYNILCCLLALVIQFGMVSRKMLQNKLDIISKLWNKDKEQYVIAKENMDRIDLMCHDLKHQIRQIGHSGGNISKDAVQDMEHIIAAYETKIKTGNDALDVILTEKSVVCNKNNIKFNCMADGAALEFMSDVDIYSLFGNAMDNAIEASLCIAENERRVIGLIIKSTDNLLSVNFHNYYESVLKFHEGLPLTTKKDKEFHGYGMRSIDLITKKYSGDIIIAAKDNIFNLNILFQL